MTPDEPIIGEDYLRPPCFNYYATDIKGTDFPRVPPSLRASKLDAEHDVDLYKRRCGYRPFPLSDAG